MLNREMTLKQAQEAVKAGRIVYVVVRQNEIVKIFSYHTEAWQYCLKMGTPDVTGLGYSKPAGAYCISYNITHPLCPRFVKFELGYINQLDLFLDTKGGLDEPK